MVILFQVPNKDIDRLPKNRYINDIRDALEKLKIKKSSTCSRKLITEKVSIQKSCSFHNGSCAYSNFKVTPLVHVNKKFDTLQKK